MVISLSQGMVKYGDNYDGEVELAVSWDSFY